MPTPQLDPRTTLFFLCDIQRKFRPAIYGYDHVVATANKLVKLAKIMGCEVVATMQNTRALGPIDPAIDLDSLGPLLVGVLDKSLFSMMTEEVASVLASRPTVTSIVLFGIESHICVQQTAISLLSLPKPYTVHVVADGVSSCNTFEIPIALDRMRQEGAVVESSESIAFQLMRDSKLPHFKTFSQFVKDQKESTRQAGNALLLGKEAAIDGEPIATAGLKSGL